MAPKYIPRDLQYRDRQRLVRFCRDTRADAPECYEHTGGRVPRSGCARDVRLLHAAQTSLLN